MKNTNNISTCCNDNCCDECIYVTTVNVSCYRTTLPVGESCFVRATPKPDNATNKKVVWSSSNNAIATVNPDSGLVTGQGVGIAVITATAVDRGIVTGTFVIEIVPFVYVQSLTVLNPELRIKLGDNGKVNMLMTPQNATNFRLKCYSSNECVATVDSTGFVRTHEVGETIITLRTTDGSNLCATCRVIVEPVLVESISLCPTSKTMIVGCEVSINEQVLPENATDKSLTWHSSNPNVARVDNAGWVTAVSEGEAIITATSTNGKVSNECKITVRKPRITIQQEGLKTVIIFNETGTKWINIGRDHVYTLKSDLPSYEQYEFGLGSEYCTDNLFTEDRVKMNKEQNIPFDLFCLKEYDDEELKMLYALDPHGVAKYVQKYADWKYSGDEEGEFAYRDSMFRLLVGRDPEYYARNEYGYWRNISYCDMLEKPRHSVASEADFIFGSRAVWDKSIGFVGLGVVLRQFADLVLSIVLVDEIVFFIDLIKDISLKNTLSTATDYAINGIIEEINIDRVNKLWGKVSVAANIVTSFAELVDEIYGEATRLPYHEKKVYAYWIDSGKYDIYIKDNNDNTIKLNDIREAFNTEE